MAHEAEARFAAAPSAPAGRMWHVTLSVAGAPVPESRIRNALEHLSEERPFLLGGRYAADRAEVRYWEEAATVEEAVGFALALWSEHRRSAGLPDWSIVGCEVLEQDAFSRRGRAPVEHPSLLASGEVLPF